jgi:hypothetical protein
MDVWIHLQDAMKSAITSVERLLNSELMEAANHAMSDLRRAQELYDAVLANVDRGQR